MGFLNSTQHASEPQWPDARQNRHRCRCADECYAHRCIKIGPLTQFGEVFTAERTEVIELSSIYGINTLRDIALSDNGGSVENPLQGEVGNTAEYKLESGSSELADAWASLRSAERGRYIPGHGGQMGMGFRIDSDNHPTGNQEVYWGLFDYDTEEGPPSIKDGFGYKLSEAPGPGEAPTLSLFIARNTSINTITRDTWNGDRADGTGPSGLTLDLERGNIFQVEFTWYGYGTIEFIVNIPNASKINQRVVLHRFAPHGQTSVLTPNLPLNALVTSPDAGDGNCIAYVAGRQYCIIGQYDAVYRITSLYRADALALNSDEWRPIFVVRRKAAYLGVAIKANSIDIEVAGAGDECWVQFRTGGSPTTDPESNWADIPDHEATETALEYNTSLVTAMPDTYPGKGDTIWTGYVPATRNRDTNLVSQKFSFDMTEQDPVTVCLKRLNGDGDTNLTAIVRYQEEW